MGKMIDEVKMMMEQTAMPTITNEHEIVAIMHKLPPERKAHVLSFARFLAYETTQTAEYTFSEEDTALKDEYTASDAHWDELLTSEGGQSALENLADEALAEIRAGKATPIVFTENGELSPE